jgi:hypothetical protein
VTLFVYRSLWRVVAAFYFCPHISTLSQTPQRKLSFAYITEGARSPQQFRGVMYHTQAHNYKGFVYYDFRLLLLFFLAPRFPLVPCRRVFQSLEGKVGLKAALALQ